MAACGVEEARVSAEALQSPDGGETWAVSLVEGAWLAVGLGGSYTRVDGAQAWRRVGRAPVSGPVHYPDPIGLQTVGATAFLNVDGAVFRTDDLGRRWTTVFPEAGEVFSWAGHAYALVSGYLLRSPDGGRTWSDTVGPKSGSSHLRLGPAADVVIVSADVAYLSDGQSAWRSRDRGTSWQAIPGVLSQHPQPSPFLGGPPGTSLLRVDHVAMEGTLYARAAAGPFFRSRDHGSTWEPVAGTVPDPPPGGSRLLAAGGTLWLSGPGTSCRLRLDPLRCERDPDVPQVYGFAPGEVGLVAATTEGTWRSGDGGRSWAPASAGIPADMSGAILVDTTYYAAANRRLFHRAPGMRWVPRQPFVSEVHSLGYTGGSIVAITADSLVACAPELRACEVHAISVPESPAGVQVLRGTGYYDNGTVHVGVRLRPTGSAVLRSDNLGRTWRVAARVPHADIFRVWIDGAVVHVLTGAGVASGREPGATLAVGDSLPRHVSPSAGAAGAGCVLVGTEAGVLYGYAMRGSSLRQTHTVVLGRDPIRAVWFAEGRPNAVLAATDDRLFWSSDGGRSFSAGERGRDIAPEQVRGITHARGDTLLVAGANGIFRVTYHIPTPGPVARSWRRWQFAIVKALFAGLVILVGSVVLRASARKRGNVSLGIGPWAWFARKVPRLLGVRVQFLPYAGFLAREKPIQRAGERFFALPAERSGVPVPADDDGTVLIESIAEATGPGQPVLVVAGGGAGKTTLLNRIAWLYVQGRLPDPWKPFRAVVVRARDYEESLAQAVATTLRNRYGVDVDSKSIGGVLASEPMLVLFDGASEIPTPGEQEAELADRVAATAERLLREAASFEFAASRVVIATRPLSWQEEFATFHIRPLTIDYVRSGVLPLYRLDDETLRRVERQVERLGSPLMPLLVNMAVEAERDGNMALSESDLYERYFRHLLKLPVGYAGDLQWDAWSVLMAALASRSLLESGQRGVGLEHARALGVAESAEAEKGSPILPRFRNDYGIRGIRSPRAALEHLASAEVLVWERRRRWSFAHDRFEEYFAARYLARVAEREGRWPHVVKWQAGDERVEGFLDVLRFAAELGATGTLLRAMPQDHPLPWRVYLEQAAPDAAAPQPRGGRGGPAPGGAPKGG